ncbi:restriction endonuclease [Halomonas alkaliantarctica]|uniref:Restriction endonuclease n=1 Tax=Halomonas alkaliantarctica TaxID=232346 RepID=A0ABY8LV47_9GAMM|nr:restriction endonuclease [Halomonas alkaliantarctica]WGI27302.1 restriction endonuclease [Halomonas alkaliantarctica]
MFITVDKVKGWRDLQSKVCQLFDEMDYETEVEKTLDLAGRGKKEVDVFIKDPLASHNQIYLVECKHWDNRVHQDVVHGFKTVMEGAGASTGYIVSKKGFQSGAYEAVRYTNIQLLTFEELQHLYGEEWFRKKNAKLEALRKQLGEIYGCHFEQGSHLPIMNNEKFISNGFGEKLAYFHHWVGDLMMAIAGIYPESYLGPEPVRLAQDPTAPLKLLDGWLEIPTVREYFELVESSASKCIEEFKALSAEANKRVDALDDRQFNEQTNKILKQLKEEMPIRVLKGKVTDEEYQRLLELFS